MIDDVFDRLFQPFEPTEVHWRLTAYDPVSHRGLALAYVDARDVMDRLDVVVGPEGWQCRYSHAEGKTVCELGLKVGSEWLWKADGAGETEVEPEKGALSDAFKRAAVRWGIGRYLYGVGPVWVSVTPSGGGGPRGSSSVGGPFGRRGGRSAPEGSTELGRGERPDETHGMGEGVQGPVPSGVEIAPPEFARLRRILAAATGVPRKSSAKAKRDGDFEFWSARLEAQDSLEGLGAVGRDLNRALTSLPHAFREPLENAYLLARERILGQEADRYSNLTWAGTGRGLAGCSAEDRAA